jgi:hypothetical protein
MTVLPPRKILTCVAIVPPLLIGIYVLMHQQMWTYGVLGGLFLMAWGTHLMVAFIMNSVMITGPVFVRAERELRFIRIALMLLGVVFYGYFGIQTVSR